MRREETGEAREGKKKHKPENWNRKHWKREALLLLSNHTILDCSCTSTPVCMLTANVDVFKALQRKLNRPFIQRIYRTTEEVVWKHLRRAATL